MEQTVQEQNKIEQLMRPRYRVIADYPDSHFSVNEILDTAKDGIRVISQKTGKSVDWLRVDKYPHLFQPLAWYQDREVGEMPQFVKSNYEVFKVEQHFKMLSHQDDKTVYDQWSHFISTNGVSRNYIFYEPATEADYLATTQPSPLNQEK